MLCNVCVVCLLPNTKDKVDPDYDWDHIKKLVDASQLDWNDLMETLSITPKTCG